MLGYVGCAAEADVRQRKDFILTTRLNRVCALLLVITLMAIPTSANAVPIADKRSEAARVKNQVDALDEKLEIAAEDYNEARLRYNKINAEVAKTDKRLKQVRGRIRTLQGALGSRAEGMYRSGPLSMLDVLLGASDFSEFTATWDFLKDLNIKDAESVAELKRAKAEAAEVEKDLKAAQAKAKAELNVMRARKATIQAQLGQRKNLLRGLESEIAALERAQRSASSARRRPLPSRGTGWDWGSPKRSPRSEVVPIAMRYLGYPYRWGAAGPNAFDCSGFTMFVYAQVGVSLPHSSRAQYSAGERVSRANLRPGDLVFFGRSRIHHVGIYVGNNQYIHSPRTGDVVRISTLNRGDYAGACRP